MTKLISPHGKTLDLTTPKVMGVLNVTPDSFSDGGRFNSIDNALNHVGQMLTYGVDIIDIGGESTRPNAPIVDTKTELDRVIPIIHAIRDKFGDEYENGLNNNEPNKKPIWLSIDTSNPMVMEQAIGAGADMVNDVRGLRRVGACEVVARLDCPVVIMHSRGEPDTMNNLAVYDDVIKEVINELALNIDNAINAGVKRDNIIIDIGMGFAKNYDEHIILMKNLKQVIDYFNLPMLFGVSRKRFLGEVLNNSGLSYLNNHTPIDRDNIGTLAHLIAIQQGANIVRVHDVKNMVQAVKLWQVLQG